MVALIIALGGSTFLLALRGRSTLSWLELRSVAICTDTSAQWADEALVDQYVVQIFTHFLARVSPR